MKSNKLLITIIGILSIIVAIVLVVAIVLLEKGGLDNSIINEQPQISNTETDTTEKILSVYEVIDNYRDYTGSVITIEGIAPTKLTNVGEVYIIDTSNKEDLLNQPIGTPQFDKNRAIMLLPTNRLQDIPTVRYGDIIRVKGLYSTRIYAGAGVYYTYDIIVESIEVVGSILDWLNTVCLL